MKKDVEFKCVYAGPADMGGDKNQGMGFIGEEYQAKPIDQIVKDANAKYSNMMMVYAAPSVWQGTDNPQFMASLRGQQEQKNENERKENKFCTECGKQNKINNKFCIECGTAFGTESHTYPQSNV